MDESFIANVPEKKFTIYFRAKSFEKTDAYKKAYTGKDVITRQPGKSYLLY